LGVPAAPVTTGVEIILSGNGSQTLFQDVDWKIFLQVPSGDELKFFLSDQKKCCNLSKGMFININTTYQLIFAG
jgi:hypothetical protein